MTTFNQNTMKSLNNKYKILVWLLTSVVTLIFIGHGTLLLFATPDSSIYTQFENYGLLKWMILIGFWELLVGGLFFIPQTSRVGYLLAMIHWGGMFFLQLSHAQPVGLALYLMILSTGINYVRNPRMLKRIKEKTGKEFKKHKKKDEIKDLTNNTKGGRYRLPTTNDGSSTHSYKSEHPKDAPQINNTEVHYANQ